MNKEIRYKRDCACYGKGCTSTSEFCIECKKVCSDQYATCMRKTNTLTKANLSSDKQMKKFFKDKKAGVKHVWE